MKPASIVLATAGAITASVFALVAFADNQTPGTATVSAAERIEHGRYLVHQVGLCVDCHTPHNEMGQQVVAKQLQGSELPFAPTVPMPFVGFAPRIAGLPAGYSAEDLTHFLMTGERPHGLPAPLPPMPPYRMNRADAEAVVAYVRTLPTGLE